MNYPHLLSPIRVGDLIVKNRLVYPNASPHFLQGPETYPNEPYRAFAAGLAKNGAGIVNFAAWDNYPQQRQGPKTMDGTHMQAFDMSDPSVHNYFSQMAEEVHFYGSKLILTAGMTYPEGYTLNGGFAGGPFGGKETKPIPKELMPQVIENYVEDLRLWKNLGFDGLSVRADMVMCPGKNERTDEYGGSLENRTRLLHEAFVAIKKAFGKKFIIEAVVAWEQPDGYGGNNAVGSGYYEKDTLEFCRLFEDVVDILQVRENNGCSSHPTGYNFVQGVHPTVEFCARAKAAGVKILLEPIGGFQEPEEMEQYIAEGKCDMIGMARGFIADPQWGEKVYEGKGDEIVPCLKCNKCHGVILPEPAPWVSICSVNPEQGLQSRLYRLVEPAKRSKKVAVIGGGAAGMRAALYCQQRGHQVTVFEKTDKLGGQLLCSEHVSFKWPIKNYKNWLVRTFLNSGIPVLMNTEATPELIAQGKFDVVLAATGAKVFIPDIPGLKDENGNLKPNVYTCLDTFGHEAELGHNVVIMGGSEVGIETAMYLAMAGHEVTVLTRQSKVAHNASGLHYITQAVVIHQPNGIATESSAWEVYPNLHSRVNVTTVNVSDGKVFYQTQAGVTYALEADSFVICGGMKPCTDEAMAYAGLTQEFYAIGDCNGAGNLEVCNREAYSRAMLL